MDNETDVQPTSVISSDPFSKYFLTGEEILDQIKTGKAMIVEYDQNVQHGGNDDVNENNDMIENNEGVVYDDNLINDIINVTPSPPVVTEEEFNKNYEKFMSFIRENESESPNQPSTR